MERACSAALRGGPSKLETKADGVYEEVTFVALSCLAVAQATDTDDAVSLYATAAIPNTFERRCLPIMRIPENPTGKSTRDYRWVEAVTTLIKTGTHG